MARTNSTTPAEKVEEEWRRFLAEKRDNESLHYIAPRQQVEQHITTAAIFQEPTIGATTAAAMAAAMAPIPDAVLHISTETKSAFLVHAATATTATAATPPFQAIPKFDIESMFWLVPMTRHIIKKEMVITATCPEHVAGIAAMCDAISAEAVYPAFCQVLGLGAMVDAATLPAKIKCKVTVGRCSKDAITLTQRQVTAAATSTKSMPYCFVIIMRYKEEEMHVKIFNTGQIKMPGKQSPRIVPRIMRILIAALGPHIPTPMGMELSYRDQLDPAATGPSTVMINSDFYCGFQIDRDALCQVLRNKYQWFVTFDRSNYPGVVVRFCYHATADALVRRQTGVFIAAGAATAAAETIPTLDINFMIFRTGKCLVVGKCTEAVIQHCYRILRDVLLEEYVAIRLVANVAKVTAEK